ncbi:MAG: ABC transporter ATP-binding protein [Eubacteriales bacterium]|nr:ABC transporter ATP-binding protein [Eubacteriales bacterium]
MARNKYDVDEELETPFDFTQFVRILRYVKPYIRKILTAMGSMIVASALSLLSPMILMVVIQDHIPDGNIKGLVIMAAALTGIIAVSSVLTAVRAKYTNESGQGIIHDIRLDMFRHLQDLPFSYFDSRPHGKILVRIVNYVNNISDLLSNGLLNVVVELISLIIIIVYMIMLSPVLTLYAMAGIPLLAIGILLLKGIQRRAHQYLSRKISNLNAYTQESISGMKVTQAFVREDENLNIFNTLSSDYRYGWMRTVMVSLSIGPYIEAVTNGTVALLYAAGALWLASSSGEAIGVGVIVAFVSYVWRFWIPINTFTSFYSQLINSAAYIERIFEFLDEPLNIEDQDDAYDLPPIKGDIEFRSVDFSYEEGVPILKNVTFKAAPGDSIALVGPTGGGKSTIVNLVSRFYDIQGGQITIDGHDIKKVRLDSLRKQMGIMLQEPFLFPGTIMENIRYGRLEATDEECIEAAKTVMAHDFIEELTDGYDTVINEQGTGVSAGEKQLISFARVLLSDPAILIMDEATASIDTKTEQALQKGLDKLLKGRTSFIIAHRLSTIRSVSQIMYISDKNILERGTHDELISCRGKYHDLYMSQFNAFV